MRYLRLAMWLAIVEFCIATIGVQIRQLPERTDFATFYLAATLLQEGQSPYEREGLIAAGHQLGFEHNQYPYLYVPSFAFLMRPLTAVDYPRARQLWMLLSAAALLLALFLALRLFADWAQAARVKNDFFLRVLATAYVVMALHSTNVHNDIRMGSVACWLLLFTTLIVWGQVRRSTALMVVGLVGSVTVKFLPVMLLPYLWWRGYRTAVGVALACLLLLGMCTAVTTYPSVHVDFFREALIPSVSEPVQWPHNFSLDAAISRLLLTDERVQGFGHWPNLRRFLTIFLSGCLALGSVALLYRRRRDLAAPLETLFVVLTLLLMMRFAWVHTAGVVLLMWALGMIALAARPGKSLRLETAVLCLGVFLPAAHLPILWGPRFHQVPEVLWTMLPTVGLLGVWFVLRRPLLRFAEVKATTGSANHASSSRSR